MTRKSLHEALDKILDDEGYADEVPKKERAYGSITVEIKYESGRVTLAVKERETRRVYA